MVALILRSPTFCHSKDIRLKEDRALLESRVDRIKRNCFAMLRMGLRSVSALLAFQALPGYAEQKSEFQVQIETAAPSLDMLWQGLNTPIHSSADLIEFAAPYNQRPDMEDQLRFETSFYDHALSSGRSTALGDTPKPGDFLYLFSINPDAYAMLEQHREQTYALGPVWTQPTISCASEVTIRMDPIAYDAAYEAFITVVEESYGDAARQYFPKDALATALIQGTLYGLEPAIEAEADKLLLPPIATFLDMRQCQFTMNFNSRDQEAMSAALEHQVAEVRDVLRLFQDEAEGSAFSLNFDLFGDAPDTPQLPDGPFYRVEFGETRPDGISVNFETAQDGPRMAGGTVSYMKIEGASTEVIGEPGRWHASMYVTLNFARTPSEAERQMLFEDRLIPESDCTGRHDYIEADIPGYMFGQTCVAGTETHLVLQDWPTDAQISNMARMPNLRGLRFEPASEILQADVISLKTLIRSLPVGIESLDLTWLVLDQPTIERDWFSHLTQLDIAGLGLQLPMQAELSD